MRVRNWNKFQHYKKRNPPWIRLYRNLLNDREWFALDGDASKMLANCWLLAAENGGELPNMTDIAFRLRLDEKFVRKQISKLNHWLEQDASAMLASRYQLATPETETETETETEKKIRKILLPDSWIPSQDHYALGEKEGLAREAVDRGAAEMRSWSLGNGESRRDWNRVFDNWLRRKATKEKSNGLETDRDRRKRESRDALAELRAFGEGRKDGDFGGSLVRLLPRAGTGGGT